MRPPESTPHAQASIKMRQRHLSRSQDGYSGVFRFWCGRGDSNPYGIATASPSSWCVCQFRHFRVRFSTAPIRQRLPTPEIPEPRRTLSIFQRSGGNNRLGTARKHAQNARADEPGRRERNSGCQQPLGRLVSPVAAARFLDTSLSHRATLRPRG